MAIPLHLAVHVLGLTVAVGLVVFGFSRRRTDDDDAGGWRALVLGGLLLAVSHVATGALLAGELAWPVYLRVAAYAALAVGAAGRLFGSSAAVVVAVAPPAAHVAAAVAGMMASVAAARGELGRGATVAPLAVGLFLWAGADAVVPTSPTAAGVLSIFGSLAAGAWLLQRAERSIFSRVLAASVSVLLVAVVALAAASGIVFAADVEADQLEELERQAASRVEQVTADWPRELRAIVQPLATPGLAQRIDDVEAGRLTDIDDRAGAIAALQTGVDVILITTEDGRVVGSWDASGSTPGPLVPGRENVLAGAPVIDEALTAEQGATAILRVGDELLVVAAAPVALADAEGRPRLDTVTGVVLVGRRVSDPRFVDEIRRRTGVEAAVLVGGDVAASTLGSELDAPIAEAVAQDPGLRTAEIGGLRRFVATDVIVDGDGVPVGSIVLTQDASEVADVEDRFTSTLFWLTLAGLLGAVGLAALTSRRITRPVRRLTVAAEKVAAGDLHTRVGIERDDEVGVLATSFDQMTATLAAREEALRAAATTEAALRGRLEAVTASMGEALLATDRDGRVTTANPAARDLLGLPASLDDVRIEDVLVGSTRTGSTLLAALGGPTADVATAVSGQVGRGRAAVAVAATAAPLRDERQRPVGRVYVLRDVTGEAEVERMKTEFLANISHELRTPLTPIKGYAEVLRAKDVDRERTVEFAGNIAASAARLERIIGMLVDFAALEAGRMEVALTPTPVGDVIDEVLARWRDLRPDRTLRRRVARGLPPVNVDPDLLQRVLHELVDNALKFSDDRVLLTADLDDSGRVRLTVRDEGSGMDVGAAELVTRDFHQLDGSATRRVGGLGLGLSIVTRILDRFDGELRIESGPDEGTAVHLLLPPVETTGKQR